MVRLHQPLDYQPPTRDQFYEGSPVPDSVADASSALLTPDENERLLDGSMSRFEAKTVMKRLEAELGTREDFATIIQPESELGNEVQIPLNMGKLRKMMTHLIIDEGTNPDLVLPSSQEVLDDLKDVMWFDFSEVPVAGDLEVIAEDARKMIAEGVLSLPFERCVFVEGLSVGGVKVTILSMLSQGNCDVLLDHITCFIHRRKMGLWVGAYDNDISILNMVRILFLSSASTDVEERPFFGKAMSLRDAPAKTSYRCVTLSKSLRGVSHGGTHASPRLHWRRGHQRRLPNSKVIWIDPMLVGDAARGTVSHDYRV